MTKENDVAKEDVYKELEEALKSDEAGEEETPVASDQKPKADEPAKTEPEDENEPLSDEEILKLSPRAQKRIREQAEEIERLKSPTPIAEETLKESPKFKNVDEFLNAVQDEPSRNLLKQFAEVIKSESSEILAPIQQKNNEVKFEETFSKYEKIEGLADYKNDLRKTFLRNPNQSIEALIGVRVADLQLSKIKPVEKTPSTPNRGLPNIDDLSKDALYDLLESQKG